MNAQDRNAQRRQAMLAKPNGAVVSSGAPRALRNKTVSAMLRKGALVKAHDRNNFGYVTRIGLDVVEVFFRNPDTGSTATVDFAPFELTVVR